MLTLQQQRVPCVPSTSRQHPAFSSACAGPVPLIVARQLQKTRTFGVPAALGRRSSRGRHLSTPVRAQSSPNGSNNKSTEFGYNRKDVLILGVGITAAGVGGYYGLQALGVDAGMAGNYVQLIVVLGLTFGWVSTYLFRVATKKMTYVQQLEDYEEAVMAKRLEEMPEAEREKLLSEVEAERERRAARQQQLQNNQNQ